MEKIDQSVIGDIERLLNEHLVEAELNLEPVLKLFVALLLELSLLLNRLYEGANTGSSLEVALS